VETEPSFVPAYINLGVAYYRLHEFGKAANIFKRGLDIDPADENLRANYRAALKAKQAAESPDGLPEGGLSMAGIVECGDIFTGVPADAPGLPAVETGPVPDGGSSGAASPYTLAGIAGLLRYLLALAPFFPASARQVFNERDSERRIKDLADALSRLEGEGNRAAAGPDPAAEAVPSAVLAAVLAAAPGQISGRVSVESLTGLLNHLGELAQALPRTERRDVLKKKVENIIEELSATM
ncbi:MAG: tetratricopeptide repeat protein, partial [Treponema sp.]|jgi:tetratricopeptide (TPR) repeat protein|nr:tetratricopeptide repeat protein [Treponema sp.]